MIQNIQTSLIKIKDYLKQNKRKVILFFAAVMTITSLIIVEVDQQKNADRQAVLQELTEEGQLIYGADDSAPPLRYVDSYGVYKGVTIDFINQLSLELGIDIVTVPYKWEDALDALKSGKTDMCDMFVDEERKENFVFTEPIYTLRTVLVVKENAQYQIEDINHLIIATQKGDFANGYLKKYYPDAELVYVHDVGAGLKLLIQGKVDGVIGDEPVESWYAQKLGYEEKIRTIETSLYEEPVVLALPKNKADLIPILNEGIENIKSKGQMEKIQQKWFGISTALPIDETQNNIRKILWIFFIVASALILLVLISSITNQTLKKQVKNRTKELEERQNELQLIFDQMPEGIVLLDPKYHIINGNYQFFLDAETSSEETETPRMCADLMHGFCEACCRQRQESCSLEKNTENDMCIVEQCFCTQQEQVKKVEKGSEIYEIHCVPAGNAETGVSVLLTVRNITIDEINSRQLLQSSKMMAVGQLAAGMAHQIRNPLGIIRTQSYIMRNSGDLDEKRKKSLDYIDDSVGRASGIIDNVMNFWRVSDEAESNINIRQLMDSVVLLQANEIRKKNIQVEILCDETVCVHSSIESMKHILHNLISNGIDAMDEGGKLILRAVQTSRQVFITCEDNGCGIAEKNLQHLFNPFFTTKEPGKGTGLGLFIVYSEVEKIGGSIEVKSTENVGTIFTLKIPESR